MLTHTDYDHVGALNLFKNAQIILSTEEMPLITGDAKRSFISGNTLPEGIDKERLTLVKDGEKLERGGHIIECIEAPGHTLGSTLYLLDDQYLFTGDAFKVSEEKLAVHPYSMHSSEAKHTIQSLKPLFDRCQWVFTAHYGYYKANALKIN